MATVGDLAREVVGALGGGPTEDSYALVLQWINRRYREMVGTVKFRQLRSVGEIQIPASYDTGTAVATRDSTTVTGTGTAWQTLMGAGSQEYYWIRLSNAWYQISSVSSETSLTLSTNYSEDTVSTAQAYTIVKKHIALPSSVRWLGTFMHDRLNAVLGEPISLMELNYIAPARHLVSAYPTIVSQVGTDSSNNVMIETYPYCEDSEILRYVYWNIPTDLTITSTIPPQIELHMLKEGVLIDLMRWKAAKAADEMDIERAAYWRNEYRAQAPVWQKYMRDASATDRAVDDVSFMLQWKNTVSPMSDIRTARDYIYYNGPNYQYV